MLTRTRLIQNKEAEEIASGKTLNRFRPETWRKLDRYKEDNLEIAGILEEHSKMILDFGCGPGTYGVILGRKNHVVGIDLARQAVIEAQRRGKTERSDFDAVVMDGEFQALVAETFDICLSAWALHHFPTPDVPLAQLCANLKPGGKIVVIEPNETALPQRISRFVENRLRRVVLSAGMDTPNRTSHTCDEYLTLLKSHGIRVSRVLSHYNGERAVIPDDISGPRRALLGIFVSARHLLFETFELFGIGAELVIIGIKPAQ